MGVRSLGHGGGAALLVALLTVGCSHHSGAAAPTAPTTTSSVPAAPATTPASTAPPPSSLPAEPTSSPAALNPPVRATAACATGGLRASLLDLGTAAGSTFYELALQDSGDGPCTMQGYPGVSFVDGHGGQLGAPATQLSGPAAPVRLAEGASAAVRIAYHDSYLSTGPGCRPTPAAGVRVYPPGQTVALVAPVSLVVCANPTATPMAGVSPVTTPGQIQP